MTNNPTPTRLTWIADAIIRDEEAQADAVDPEGHRPSPEYLRGYRAATERAAEVVQGLAVGATLQLLDTADIGGLFGVKPQTVRTWRVRYAGTDHPCPEPDGTVGKNKPVPVWFPERKKDWLEWEKTRAGRWPTNRQD